MSGLYSPILEQAGFLKRKAADAQQTENYTWFNADFTWSKTADAPQTENYTWFDANFTWR
ncbi:hypothetical protein ABZP26_02000 [Pseudoalteromonas sp. SD03]|uniref:Uncharacterized protein n=1 Tax=Pseudoalteromonas sp. SD03 TaxID=3231719 RepID=A0AB39ARH7_9GAMM